MATKLTLKAKSLKRIEIDRKASLETGNQVYQIVLSQVEGSKLSALKKARIGKTSSFASSALSLREVEEGFRVQAERLRALDSGLTVKVNSELYEPIELPVSALASKGAESKLSRALKSLFEACPEAVTLKGLEGKAFDFDLILEAEASLKEARKSGQAVKEAISSALDSGLIEEGSRLDGILILLKEARGLKAEGEGKDSPFVRLLKALKSGDSEWLDLEIVEVDALLSPQAEESKEALIEAVSA